MNLEQQELDDILFYSFRYALGRRTHAVSTVGNAIIRHRGDISESVASAISLEIKAAEKEGRLGDQCDIDQWLNVYNTLNCDEEKI